MPSKRECVGISAASEAGQCLLDFFGNKIFSKEKSPLDLVSEADSVSEGILIEKIKECFPEDRIITEEAGCLPGTTGYTWILDPLDGTHTFLAGYPHFGVSVALEKDGVVLFGVCCFPAIREFLTAYRGQGAFLNDKEIRVSPADNLKGGMFLSDSIVRKKPMEILRDIERFCGAGCRLRVFGSSLFAFTRVAMGQAVAATNRCGHPWDIAASALMVEEAGGRVTDESGGPWGVYSANLLATNGLVHGPAFALFS